jgi:hypothetical protein
MRGRPFKQVCNVLQREAHDKYGAKLASSNDFHEGDQGRIDEALGSCHGHGASG